MYSNRVTQFRFGSQLFYSGLRTIFLFSVFRAIASNKINIPKATRNQGEFINNKLANLIDAHRIYGLTLNSSTIFIYTLNIWIVFNVIVFFLFIKKFR